MTYTEKYEYDDDNPRDRMLLAWVLAAEFTLAGQQEIEEFIALDDGEVN